MANSIRYSEGTDSILNTAAKIDSLNDEFYSEYTEFYSTIEGELMVNWKGEDSEAFREKVGDMKHFFDTMREAMNDYAAFLRQTANAHESRMEDSRSMIDTNCKF